MKSFGRYITKLMVSFVGFILVLALVNIIAFGFTFYDVITRDYGLDSPQKLLEQTAASATEEGISEEMVIRLQQEDIWAMLLGEDGQVRWSLDLPEEVPVDYSITEVAVFSKGYIEDYPVFVWNSKEELLVLGYPKNSYTKINNNYYPLRAVQILPIFVMLLVSIDLLLLFLAYYFSKHKIIDGTAPIIGAVEALSHGEPVNLTIKGELSEVAEGLNKTSQILNRQNEARANWISGVSHDIRTPLSMIMGYADRIATDQAANDRIKEQAKIVRKQSLNIKELVQDLNLVSQLEYTMQPIKKMPLRVSKLLRTYTADLLNDGIEKGYSIELEIAPYADQIIFECDARLLNRAISNLVQNSIKHNPQGCDITIMLLCFEESFSISVQDNGIGILSERLQKLNLESKEIGSTDDSLNLKFGLGLLLVRQITEAHFGKIKIESDKEVRFKTTLTFSKKNTSFTGEQ